MLIKNSEQNTYSTKFTCDFCGDNPASNIKGYADVAQGATGRWCEVMWSCDNCGDSRIAEGHQALHVAEARERIATTRQGRVDF